MLKILIEADTPEEAARFVHLLAQETPAAPVAPRKVAEAPPRPPTFAVVPKIETPASTEPAPTEPTKPAEPAPAEPAKPTPVPEQPDSDDGDDETLPADRPPLHMSVAAEPQLAKTILRIYHRNPRAINKKVFAETSGVYTQADIRRMRKILCTTHLLRTKGKKSPHYVTQWGREFLATPDADSPETPAPAPVPAPDATPAPAAPAPPVAAPAPTPAPQVSAPAAAEPTGKDTTSQHTFAECRDLIRDLINGVTDGAVKAKRIADMTKIVQSFGVSTAQNIPLCGPGSIDSFFEKLCTYRDSLAG